jgi:hypothetical protein
MERLEDVLKKFKAELREVASKACAPENTVEQLYAVQQILICAEKTLIDCANTAKKLKQELSTELESKKGLWGGP